ncbi:HEAT repeat domain-containing protein [Mucilaginibacter daejeonensis]|uniref:HEAT repeat domain-containing protein n=1 Tax=Mucilaginibacter daejeonensis TaxID=398049 RepID=UPI001D17091B|nr:HEAT repeat domain-containing protein [Mucilaginibacter daejeonensis]UEG52200.1 HEAT repeat domain-containing protein [Mucilaginibacter daejeonensis]
MRYSISLLCLLVFSVMCSKAFATTWDEPWMDKVIKQANSFVLAKVDTAGTDKGQLKILVLKTVAGQAIQGRVILSGFYDLHLCSRSGGDGPEYHFKGIDSCYFLLKENGTGGYAIATPTTGYAWIKNGKVAATYRHSYHQARVDIAPFELTMGAIFSHYHQKPYDTSAIESYVNKYLIMKPAGLQPKELNTFFNQHVALECVYHLQLKGHADQVLKFLSDKQNFHAQVSAVRALTNYNTQKSKEALMELLTAKEVNDFVKVIAIWTLRSYTPIELKPRLIKIATTASEEENGFGGNIMDPRVCTHFPTVKGALTELVKSI